MFIFEAGTRIRPFNEEWLLLDVVRDVVLDIMMPLLDFVAL